MTRASSCSSNHICFSASLSCLVLLLVHLDAVSCWPERTFSPEINDRNREDGKENDCSSQVQIDAGWIGS